MTPDAVAAAPASLMSTGAAGAASSGKELKCARLRPPLIELWSHLTRSPPNPEWSILRARSL